MRAEQGTALETAAAGATARETTAVSQVRSAATIEVAGATDAGRLRARNEDAFCIDPEMGLCVVADGMGGHPAGDVAARMAVEEVAKFMRELAGSPTTKGVLQTTWVTLSPGFLSQAVQHANRVIHMASQTLADCGNMGTTVAAALFARGTVALAHVGDSRVYRLREGVLSALTEDDSLAAHYVRSRGTAADPRVVERHRSTLTRCLGTQPEVRVSVNALRCAPGDVYLMCTDGLWGVLPHDSMGLLLAGIADPQEAVRALIDAANAAGSPDNITAVVARPAVR